MPRREVYQVPMRPIAGSRFQPTGFPDLGAALFTRPVRVDDRHPDGWDRSLVVESAQSMANRLEATAWDARKQEPVEAFAGLPYIRVVDRQGEYLTSSRVEAHRIAAAFVKDSTLDGRPMREVIKERLGLRDDRPLDYRGICAAVFALDPMCLVHGVFFADKSEVWPGQPKIARALTSFVEAHDVMEAVSGGVKRDDVRHSVQGGRGASEGYGFVPFHRTEYVAREIEASFLLDLDQLASYGLPDAPSEFLATAARWEVRALLDGGFRPRTACDLEVKDPSSLERLPDLDDLTRRLRDLGGRCGDLIGKGEPITVSWDPKQVSRRRSTGEEEPS